MIKNAMSKKCKAFTFTTQTQPDRGNQQMVVIAYLRSVIRPSEVGFQSTRVYPSLTESGRSKDLLDQ